MNNWSKPYLSIFDKTLDEIPQQTIEAIRKKISIRQSDAPIASVVLIAHNEEKHLASCVWSLAENRCDIPIEILGVNNNSTDRTAEMLERLGVPCLEEKQKGPGFARQCGLDHARGKYHLCIDADTLYPPYYIITHLRELMKPGVSCTFSLWSFMTDEEHSKLGLWIYESLRDIYLRGQFIKRPELCVRGMAFGFNTSQARLFGFRTDIIRGEDGSLALAMKTQGKIVFITSQKARVLTSNGTINSKGSLLKNLKVQLILAFKKFGELFTKKSEYKDEDSNLIKNKK